MDRYTLDTLIESLGTHLGVYYAERLRVARREAIEDQCERIVLVSEHESLPFIFDHARGLVRINGCVGRPARSTGLPLAVAVAWLAPHLRDGEFTSEEIWEDHLWSYKTRDQPQRTAISPGTPDRTRPC